MDRRTMLLGVSTACWTFALPFPPSPAAEQRCDGRSPGLFRNIGCLRTWRRRIEAKQRRLARLRQDYVRLQKRNASLRMQHRAAKALLDEARAEAEEALRRLTYYRRVEVNVDNLVARFRQLELEFDLIGEMLDGGVEVSPDCVTPEYQRRLREAERMRGILEEGRNMITGIILDWLAGKVTEAMKRAPNVWVRGLGWVLDGIRAFFGLKESIERGQRIYREFRSRTLPLECQ